MSLNTAGENKCLFCRNPYSGIQTPLWHWCKSRSITELREEKRESVASTCVHTNFSTILCEEKERERVRGREREREREREGKEKEKKSGRSPDQGSTAQWLLISSWAPGYKAQIKSWPLCMARLKNVVRATRNFVVAGHRPVPTDR